MLYQAWRPGGRAAGRLKPEWLRSRIREMGGALREKRGGARKPDGARGARRPNDPHANIREMGGAPRNPAPGNHFLAWIVKLSGCHRTGAFGEHKYRRVPTPLRSNFPFSDRTTQDDNRTMP